MSRYTPYLLGAILWPIVFPIVVAVWWAVSTIIVCAIAYAIGAAVHHVAGMLLAIVAAVIWLTPQIWLFKRMWRNTHGAQAPQTGVRGFLVDPPGYLIRGGKKE